MRVHVVRQVEYEGLGCLRPVLVQGGCTITESRAWQPQPFPSPDAFDALIVLGGPMGVCDSDPAPWMPAERRFLAESIAAGRAVLGICLGGQLLASVLGAAVRRHEHAEVGWHRLQPTPEGADGPLAPFFEPGTHVLQWHFDTFDIPAGATRLCASDACANQAFAWGDRVLALQFHPEMTFAEVATVLERDGTGPEGPWVQTPDELLQPERFERLAASSAEFLRRLLADWAVLS